jgi:hypothetical protein
LTTPATTRSRSSALVVPAAAVAFVAAAVAFARTGAVKRRPYMNRIACPPATPIRRQ